MSTTQQTLGPLAVGRERTGRPNIKSACGATIAVMSSGVQIRHAEALVRAVNSHAAFVELARAVLDYFGPGEETNPLKVLAVRALVDAGKSGQVSGHDDRIPSRGNSE